MLGVILDAIGVPAAAMRIAVPGRLEVVTANSALEALLGCDPGALAGQPASVLVPEGVAARWTGQVPAELVETRLGEFALPYRANARPLNLDDAGAPGLLVTFLPAAAPNVLQLAGLGPVDLGVTALEVLDMQAEMVSRWRPDGTILYCNEAFARQCQRSIDEVIGANLFDLTPPHEIDQIRRNVARLSAAATRPRATTTTSPEAPKASAGRSGSTDCSWTTGAGSPAICRSAGTSPPASWPSGSSPKASGGSSWRWRLAGRACGSSTSLPAGSTSTTRSRTCCVCRSAPTSSTSRVPPTPTTPTTASRSGAAIAAVVAGETDAYRVEARRRRGDGSYFWVMNFGRVAERDPQGRPLRMVGTTIDIDQRKEVELSLGDREQRLRLGAGSRQSRRLGVRPGGGAHPL